MYPTLTFRTIRSGNCKIFQGNILPAGDILLLETTDGHRYKYKSTVDGWQRYDCINIGCTYQVLVNIILKKDTSRKRHREAYDGLDEIVPTENICGHNHLPAVGKS